MLTILSSRKNTKETTLNIGFTNNFEEAGVFSKCIANSLGMEFRGGKNGIQKGRKKAK